MDEAVGAGNRERIKAYTAGACFAVAVGFSFLSIKVCVPVASTLEILTFRYNFAFLASLVPIFLRVVKIDLKGKNNRALFFAAATYIGFMALQAGGLVFSTSVESAIIFAIIPIIAKIVAGIFLGEQSTWKQNIFVTLSVCSLIVMIVMGAAGLEISAPGMILLVLASVSLAVSNVLMRYVRKEHAPFDVVVVISALGFVVFNLVYLIQLTVRGDISSYFAPAESLRFLVATAYLGIPCLVLSAWLMSYMLARLEAIQATIFGNLSTAISIVAGAVLLSEPLYSYHIVCTVMIVAGVIGVSITGKKEEEIACSK